MPGSGQKGLAAAAVLGQGRGAVEGKAEQGE